MWALIFELLAPNKVHFSWIRRLSIGLYICSSPQTSIFWGRHRSNVIWIRDITALQRARASMVLINIAYSCRQEACRYRHSLSAIYVNVVYQQVDPQIFHCLRKINRLFTLSEGTLSWVCGRVISNNPLADAISVTTSVLHKIGH